MGMGSRMEMALNFGAMPIAVLSGAGREEALRKKTERVFRNVPEVCRLAIEAIIFMISLVVRISCV